MKRGIAAALGLVVLLAATVGYLLLFHPSKLVNPVARYLLKLDFSVGAIEWVVTDGRLLLHLQDIDYRREAPELRVQLAHLAVDLSLGVRRLNINEIFVSGGEVDVRQVGDVPWWQQFGGEAGAELEPQDDDRGGWEVRARGVFLGDTVLRIALEEEQRNYTLELEHISSGVSLQHVRWVQLKASMDGLPLHIQGETLEPETALEHREPFTVNWDMDLAGLVLRINGRLDLFNRLGDTNVEIVADAASLPRFAALFDLELPPFEVASVRGRLIDGAWGFGLADVDMHFQTANMRVAIAGSVRRPLQDWQPQLDVDIDIESFQQTLAAFGVDMGVDFSVDLHGLLTRPDRYLQLSGASGGITLKGFEVPGERQFGFSDAEVTLPKNEITGWSGPFSLPLEVAGGTLLVAMEFDERLLFYDLPVKRVGMVIRADGMDLEGAGRYKELPIKVDFRMLQNWKLLESRLRSEGTRLSLNSDFTKPWIPLDVSADLEDARALNRWLRLNLPEQTPVRVSTLVRIADGGKVGVRNLELELEPEEPERIALSIPRYDFFRPRVVAGSVNARIDSLSRLVPVADEVIAYINHEGWLNLMGDLSTRAPDSRRPDRQLIPTTLAAQLEQRPWLEGGLKLGIRLEYDEDRLAVEQLNLGFKSPRVRLTAQGSLAYGRGRPGADLAVSAHFAPGTLLPVTVPIDADGRLRSRGDELLGEDITVRAGRSALRGHFELSQVDAARPRLVASLTSGYWGLGTSLAPLLEREVKQKPKPKSKSKSKPAGPGKPEPAEARLFSAHPFDLSALDRLDAYVSLGGEELDLGLFAVHDWQLAVALRRGELTIAPLRLNALGGSVFGRMERRLEAGRNRWELELAAEELDFSQLKSVDGDGPPNSGLLSAWADLSAEGNSAREIANTLRGRFSERTLDFTIYGIDLNRLAPSFMNTTIGLLEGVLSRDSRQQARTAVECQAAQLLFGDGLMIADRSILARTDLSNFVATWMLDFSTEEQRIQVIPKVRKGINLGVSDLLRTVQVSGSLLDPKLQVDPGGLFLVGAESVALYATGGWLFYLGWRQVENNLTRPDACERLAHNYLFTPTANLKLPVRVGRLPVAP